MREGREESATVVPIDVGRRGEGERGLEGRDDDDLMVLARAGRTAAFDVLVRRHQRWALRLAHKAVGDPTLAQDVAQQAFVDLYRYLPRYRPGGTLRALLARIVLNRARMSHRAAAARQRALDRLSAQPAGSTELPDDGILRRERRREAERALGRLSGKLREVVLLRYAAELSYEEISTTLDIPIGTVRSRIAAAVVKLRRQIAKGP